jgi:L-aspartate oxidase
MLAEKTACQYLDLRHLSAQQMHARFPTISAICRQHGLDLACDLLPVAPAAHYCMGGVLVDTEGQTTLPGLYAVGEVSCTGVHGANRLASNSLLEGLVYGIRVAEGLAGKKARATGRHTLRAATTLITYDDSLDQEILSSGNMDEVMIRQIRSQLRQIMWQHVSLSRDQNGLLEAKHKVRAWRSLLTHGEDATLRPYYAETMNMLQVAELVIAAALERHESRGSHWRLDYQATDDRLAKHHYAFQRHCIDHYRCLQRQEEVMPLCIGHQ